jgi:hypothetical protein
MQPNERTNRHRLAPRRTMVVAVNMTAEKAAELGDRARVEAQALNRSASVARRDAFVLRELRLLTQAERRRQDTEDLAAKRDWWADLAEACREAIR